MTIQYFEDTDTLYIVSKNTDVAETRDLDENTLMEFDAKGNLVAITIEHGSVQSFRTSHFRGSQPPAHRPKQEKDAHGV